VKDGCPFLASSFGHAKEEGYTSKNKNTKFYVHFFTCIKKRTSSEAAKKVQPFTWSTCG
jgi:hypothetical protein